MTPEPRIGTEFGTSDTWREFARDAEHLLGDGSKFLSELRAILKLETRIIKLALLRVIALFAVIVLLTLTIYLTTNVGVVLLIGTQLDVSWAAAVLIDLLLNIVFLVLCVVALKSYLPLVGVSRTKALLSKAKYRGAHVDS